MKGYTSVVFLSPETTASDSGILLRPVGGVPLFLRTLLALQRAGCSKLTVLAPGSGAVSDRLRELARDSRVRCPVDWICTKENAARPEGRNGRTGSEAFLRVAANQVFDFQALRSLPPPAEGEIVALGGPAGGLDACGAGLPESIVESVADEGAWQARLNDLARSGKLRQAPAPSYWQRVDSTRDLQEAERKVFHALRDNEGGLEGFLDRHLTRHLSMPLTGLLARTPLTPNQVTFLSFVVGIASLYFFAQPGHGNKVAAALLFLLSTVIDCCDGEIARLKFQQSRWGGILDMAFDTVIHTLLMLCIGFGLRQDLDKPVAVWLGIACAIGSFLACLFTLVNQILETRTLSMVSTPQESTVQSKSRFSRLIEAFSNRDFSWYLLLVTLLGQLYPLLWVFAFGVQVFWITLAVLYFRDHSRRRVRKCASTSARVD
ncbi:MAG: CDP-alcohol phosphatidyltransferase family protein [Planctomycetes bacterium]|nr:CDP-alcohol phosphatidyltransferase family protein [Planctomycetota bacterium]